MKVLVGLFMLVTLGVAAQAQDAKVLTEYLANSEKIVKGAPFSAEAISESVQTLADGNRIVHSSTGKLYRNSEGRFRREMTNGSGGLLASTFSYSPSVTILDPVLGRSYQLNEELKTAQEALLKVQTLQLQPLMKMTMDPQLRTKIETASTAANDAEREAALDKLRAELKAMPPVAAVGTGGAGVTTIVPGVAAGVAGGVNIFSAAPLARSKYESRTENLGTQTFEGVEAEGTRTVTTIPAGAIGNERPIEVVYERWYSKELQVVVMSKTSDPRSGEQTYKLTNINRSEPDPSLFSLPTGYRVTTRSEPVYSVAPSKAVAAVPSVKPVPAVATSVKNKP